MSSEKRPAVLALDPGRAKCGIAVVDEQCTLLHRCVVAPGECSGVVAELLDRYPIVSIVLGDGTGSGAMHTALCTASPDVPIEVVDERHTSEEARARRIAEERSGWRRLIPAGLLTPSSPYDDLVAVILAERWWRTRR
jgi:RNase H-fold protein (predicted Holliday junction resolvase)